MKLEGKKELLVKVFPYAILLFCCLNVFFHPLINADEIWNYSFANNIFQGRLPYRDFNIIQTPLSSYMAIPFLFIFGNNLFSIRIAHYLMFFLILLVFYKICMLFCNCMPVALITSVFIFILNLSMVIYNYNYINLLLSLFFVYKEMKLKKSDDREYLTKDLIILGLTAGITITVKQTTGLFMILANILISIFDWKSRNYTLSKAMLRISVSFIPAIFFILYLFILNIMGDFLEYAVFGIKNFTHKISFIQFLSMSIGHFCVGIFFIFILLLAIFKCVFDKPKREIIFTYLIVIFSNLVVAYPLCDPSHFYVVFVIELPLLFYLFNFKPLKRWNFIIMIPLIMFFSVIGFIVNNTLFEEGYIYSDLKHFEYIPINYEIEKNIKNIENFIRDKEKQGKKVYIADVIASTIMIPMDKYNKDFDMLLVGNIGLKTTNVLINELKGSLVLITKNEGGLNMQDDYELIHYIKQNYRCEERVGNFEVYKIE